MALGKPSTRALLAISDRVALRINARTLALLKKERLAEPRGKTPSTDSRDWALTDSGHLAVASVRAGRTAYLPSEYGAERERLSARAEARDSVSVGRYEPGFLRSRCAAATWNLRASSDPDSILRHLEYAHWDIACLQEVGVVAANRIAERADWSVLNGLELAWEGEFKQWSRPHGAAIIARNGWHIDGGELVPDLPVPGRGVMATVTRGNEGLSVVSWHAPNAVPRKGETKRRAIERKMAAYRALNHRLQRVSAPAVAGMDANHWNLGTGLAPLDPPDTSDPFYDEQRFFSTAADHGLVDALLVYLRARPQEHKKRIEQRPDGPLEITHRRGGRGRLDRFDYLMISGDLDVEAVSHDFAGSCRAGSDHGLVSATLTPRRRR